jgi:Zn finger protein HypA/HybF involved in hydrogenase expression
MSFTFTDNTETRVVLACQECAYASTEKHFANGPSCPLCHGKELKQIDEVPKELSG